MQTLNRALAILDVLAAADGVGLGVRELAGAAGIPKSAVGRTLSVLMEAGLSTQDPGSRRYALGPKAATLGHAYATRTDVVRLSRSDMVSLRDQTGETVSLNVRSGWARICVAQIESQNELRAAGEIGKAYPLDSGAAGRVILHGMTEKEIAYVLDNRKSLCDYKTNRPMGREQVFQSLKFISRHGYTVANQETMRGVCSIAVPLRKPSGAIEAALGLLVPHDRFAKSKERELIEAVRATAASIEGRLGWSDGTIRGRASA